jgi:phage tail-like protein
VAEFRDVLKRVTHSRFFDLLQTHRFWLLDLIPSTTFPFFVLGSPMYGFASITAPEITLQTREIKQLNSMWTTVAYEGGGCGPITLTRGARMNDDTLYDWVKRAMRGSDMVQRTMLLIHYTGVNAFQEAGGFSLDLPVPLETWEGATFVPGRVWVLWSCLPVRYKAGSDFDANSADVSMMELEMQPHAVEEIVLGASRGDMFAAAALPIGLGVKKIIKG